MKGCSHPEAPVLCLPCRPGPLFRAPQGPGGGTPDRGGRLRLICTLRAQAPPASESAQASDRSHQGGRPPPGPGLLARHAGRRADGRVAVPEHPLTPARPLAAENKTLPRSSSMAAGLERNGRPRVKAIFSHAAGDNSTLLSFKEGDLITLLVPEARDGWHYGESEKTKM